MICFFEWLDIRQLLYMIMETNASANTQLVVISSAQARNAVLIGLMSFSALGVAMHFPVLSELAIVLSALCLQRLQKRGVILFLFHASSVGNIRQISSTVPCTHVYLPIVCLSAIITWICRVKTNRRMLYYPWCKYAASLDCALR